MFSSWLFSGYSFLEEEHTGSAILSHHSKRTYCQYDITVGVNLDHLAESMSLFVKQL